MTNKHIAIIGWGAMADVAYAIPIVRHIRQLHPEANITWLIRDKFAEIIKDNLDINNVLEFKLPDGYKTRQDAEHVMDQQILKYANENFEKVYDLQYWPRYSNFYQYVNEDFISLRARNAGLDPLQIKNRKISFNILSKDKIAAFEFLDQAGLYKCGLKFITCNHISYASSPVWDITKYEYLFRLLDEKGIKAICTGAHNEPLPCGAIDARGISYLQWTEIISWSDCWLGLDSGAKALAASTETPMIVLHSRDFPILKTGCASMGIRTKNICELFTTPSVDTVFNLILKMINENEYR